MRKIQNELRSNDPKVWPLSFSVYLGKRLCSVIVFQIYYPCINIDALSQNKRISVALHYTNLIESHIINTFTQLLNRIN